MNIIIISVVILVSVATKISGNGNNDGFLPGSFCNEAQDCYLFDDGGRMGLQLTCWNNVNQCKCENAFRSDHHMRFEDGKCRMSKFGPCRKKPNSVLEVDCLDGFKCVENQCRDPANPDKSTKSGPFRFERSCSEGCEFAEVLDLECDHDEDKCVCKKVRMADARGTLWDIRNYDGDKKCSVGKFGPCGREDGIELECHGAGIGTCLDPSHPISEVNEACQSEENCREGLLCSRDRTCIEPKTSVAGSRCGSDYECKEGLRCGRKPGASRFGGRGRTCGSEADFQQRK